MLINGIAPSALEGASQVLTTLLARMESGAKPPTTIGAPMGKVIHPLAGTIAMLCIGSFWLSTLDASVLVKHTILQAMWVMIPAMAATGGRI